MPSQELGQPAQEGVTKNIFLNVYQSPVNIGNEKKNIVNLLWQTSIKMYGWNLSKDMLGNTSYFCCEMQIQLTFNFSIPKETRIMTWHIINICIVGSLRIPWRPSSQRIQVDFFMTVTGRFLNKCNLKECFQYQSKKMLQL